MKPACLYIGLIAIEILANEHSVMNIITFPTVCSLIIFLSLTACNHNIGALGCTHFENVEYRKGFRCRTDKNIFNNLTDITHHDCTHRCMTLQGCILVNYNMEQRYCSLSNEVCLEYIADYGFVVAYFGSKEAMCVKWVSYTLYDYANAIVALNCADLIYPNCALGRLKTPFGHLLPGNFFDSGIIPMIKTVFHTGVTTSGEKEVLNIQDGCRVIWVNYTAHEPLPVGAIVGGYMVGDGRNDLYVMRALFNGFHSFGYYNPVTALGYAVYTGGHSVISMELLVVI